MRYYWDIELPLEAFQPTGKRLRLHGGGGKGSPPQPNYQGAAEAQGQSAKEVTNMQTWANRPNIYTPWGQQTWQSGVTTDPASGQAVTNWASNINLSPDLNQALTDQNAISAGKSAAARGLIGQVANATSTPFNWRGLPDVPGNIGDAQRGAFATMSAALQPGRMQADAALDTKLANMGLPRNSEAWNRAKMQLQGQWTQEDKTMMSQALSEGRLDASTQAQLRQQAIAEQAQKRGMSLNELNALLTGTQVSMPQGFAGAPSTTAGAAQPTQYLQAALGQGQAATAAGGNDWGSAIGGIGSIAGALASAGAFSDARLKSNIRYVSPHPIGVGIYTYEIFGKPEIGVMAQDLLMVAPELVHQHPSGFLMVDYKGLAERV